MNWKHGWRLGAHREKTEFLLAELVAECLDVVARLSTLAAVFSAPDTDGKRAIWPACTKKPSLSETRSQDCG